MQDKVAFALELRDVQQNEVGQFFAYDSGFHGFLFQVCGVREALNLLKLNNHSDSGCSAASIQGMATGGTLRVHSANKLC